MDRFVALLDRHPLIFSHVLLALGALALGIFILLLRKGDTRHRTLGWVWVVLMGGAALTSAFIRDFHLPNIAGFTPIHAFTALVAVELPRAVWHVRHGRVQAHRQAMRGLYIGGCVVAGTLAFLPGRFLGSMLWPRVSALLG